MTATPAPMGVSDSDGRTGHEESAAAGSDPRRCADREPGRGREARAGGLVQSAPAPGSGRAPASVERSVGAAKEHEGIPALAADGDHVADRDHVIAAGVQVAQRAGDPGDRAVEDRDPVALAPRDLAPLLGVRGLAGEGRGPVGSCSAASTLTPNGALRARPRAASASRGRGRRASAADRATARSTALAVAPAGAVGAEAVTTVTAVGSERHRGWRQLIGRRRGPRGRKV